MADRKTASDILIQRFLKDVEEKQSMPWQRPYQVYNAFNWLTLKPYRGFNRILLPFGEYLTKNQINQINKDKGEDYKFAKGIEWFPITFFKRDKRQCSREEILAQAPDDCDIDTPGYLFRDDYWQYYKNEDGTYEKARNILRYYEVADIKHFVNSKGETLPSRIATGEVELTFSRPKDVLENYINNSGVTLDDTYKGIPSYVPSLDLIRLNKNVSSEEEYYSTGFHECGHSTGASFRLNRKGVAQSSNNKSVYAVEECIAEITAGLCCAECQIYNVVTSESKTYDNSIAYVQSWKKRVKDWGKEFIYIVSQAEQAFNYIMNISEEDEEVE